MNEHETILLRAASEHLRECARKLIDGGWRPELVVFTADEECLARIPGYKVALVVPLDAPRVSSPPEEATE